MHRVRSRGEGERGKRKGEGGGVRLKKSWLFEIWIPPPKNLFSCLNLKKKIALCSTPVLEVLLVLVPKVVSETVLVPLNTKLLRGTSSSTSGGTDSGTSSASSQ